jgi:hypothetical protein
MIVDKSITQLALSVNEKDVENSYRQYLTKKISDMMFTSPFGCDGLGESKNNNIRVLCEFKDDLDLQSKTGQIKVLSQAIYYIKKFEISGVILPSTVFVGDKNECFVIHTNDLFKYLSMDLDWSIAPSNAHKNLILINEMLVDENINPHVFSVTNIDECVQKLKDLTEGVTRLIPITPHNLTEVFGYFEKNVLAKNTLNTNQLANLFTQILINSNDNYLHPVKKRKTIVTKAFNEVPIKSREAFTSFFSHFANDYTPKQKEQLTATVDRLIQDVTRRKQGEFFTPTIWVDKAHEYITSVFGEDWKEKYVVWDPAWGTGNLTRDYKFKELYVSTLNYSDIQTAEQMGYNPEAVKFQFDFLNDGYEFLPKGLRDAIEGGRDIIVLMNPPYASSANKSTIIGDDKKGVSETTMSILMKSEDWGKSVQNLYSQFLFRSFKLNINNNVNICIFCPPLFLSGESFKKFRSEFMNIYKFTSGFLFSANNFDEVSDGWGISFSILESKINNLNNDFYCFTLVETDENFDLKNVGYKKIYNTDSRIPANEWVKKEIKKIKTFDAPQQSSPCVIKQKGCGKISNNALGYFLTNSNNVQFNRTGCSLFSSCYSGGHGISITEQNFYKVVSLFTARKTILETWETQKDEYLKPNELNQNYQQYLNDSIIYSLFSTYSYQSSLRQVTYKDKLWGIKNEFFWMSKEEMMELANNSNYTELYTDARTDNNRHVYNLLFGEENIYSKLSPDAKLILDKATDLVRKSITIRSHFADDQNHLNSWDAGYAQLKLIWKEYFVEEFKEFRQLYKNLEDRMRPLVYELGFLLK